MTTHKNNNKKGAALIIVVMVFAVLMVVGTAALRIMTTETQLAMNSYDKSKAHYVAKSGADATAAYIMDNPEKLEQLANSTSNKTSLDGDNSFVVTVTEIGDTVEIVSVGEVNSGVKATVTVTLKSQNDSFIPEAALYLNTPDNDDFKYVIKETKIHGDVVVPRNDLEYDLDKAKNDKNKKIDVDDFIVDDDLEFTMPDVPDIPATMTKTNRHQYQRSLVNNTDYRYSSGIKINSTVNVTVGDDDFVIRAKGLTIENKGKIKVNKTGSGRLIIYIDGENDVVIQDKATINLNGKPEDVIIYYTNTKNNKGGKKLVIQDDAKVNADIHAYSEEIEIKNKTQYNGTIIHKPSKDGIVNISIIDKAHLNNALIYAPESYTKLESKLMMKGSVITKYSEMNCNKSGGIQYRSINDSYLIDTITGGEPSLQKQAYK